MAASRHRLSIRLASGLALTWALSLTPAAAAEEEHSPRRMGDAWSDPDNPIAKLFHGQRLDLWSLRPLAAPDVPAPKHASWVRQPVDAFILDRLEREGLSPAPEADKRTLLRRLSFDLTGLPPSAETMADFLADAAPDAWKRTADKLLASRAFGEHWARFWLDAVRYSDSNGFDWDEFRPQAWRYRDWVIRALNADVPYDKFVRMQLAGDEMVSGAPRHAAEQDCLIATGYLRMGPWDNSSKLFNEQDKSRAAMLADLTETTAAVFLGMTMSCCRCHDHKTEPLSQQDHYRLRAIFAGVEFRDASPIGLAPEQEAVGHHNAEVETEIAAAEARKKDRRDAVRNRLAQAAKRKPAEVPDKEVEAALDKADRAALEQEDKGIAAARKKLRQHLTAMIVGQKGGAENEMHVLALGDPTQKRERIEPGIPAVFDPNPLPSGQTAASGAPGRRTALADWLLAEKNPLTARVIVNRIWQQLFGAGMVATPNDFGFSGARPSHPELLDWLARRFMQDGWSIKKLIALLVDSAAYRQSAYPPEAARAAGTAKDAANVLLWRANPKRLTAEMLRDAMLVAAGQMLPGEGGPPVWPDLPSEVLQANPAFLDDNAEKTKGWYPSPPDKRNVRSIYLIQKRSVALPFMQTFDQPDNFCSCGRRIVSTVAPQALTLLNGEMSVAAATALGSRLARECGTDSAAMVRKGFLLSLQREPSLAESAACLQFLQTRTAAEFARLLLNLNEFCYAD